MNPKKQQHRIAVAQLKYHPAFESSTSRCLCEPDGDFITSRLHRLRVHHLEAGALIQRLRRRIQETYLQHFWARLKRVVELSRQLNVDFLILPEYSVPAQLLLPLAESAGEHMVVVAGTHLVTDELIDEGIYTALHSKFEARAGTAISPILHGGKMIACQEKLTRSQWERELTPGETWSSVSVTSADEVMQLGVLICLDFLRKNESALAQKIAGLETCSLIAVTSHTPFSSLEHFDRNAEELLDGYGRLVAYANAAEEGGSGLYTRDSQSSSAAPLGAGRPPRLPKGVEGLVVADVVLEGQSPLRPTPYQHILPSVPVACSLLLDPRRWPELASAEREVLEAPTRKEAKRQVEVNSGAFRQAASDTRLPEIGRARWLYLADGASSVHQREILNGYAQDIWLPDSVPSHEELQAGLRQGTRQVLEAALKNWSLEKGDERALAQAINGLEPPGEEQGTSESPLQREIAAALTQLLEPETALVLTGCKSSPSTQNACWTSALIKLPEALVRHGWKLWAALDLASLVDVETLDVAPGLAEGLEALHHRWHELRLAAGVLARKGHPPAWVGLTAHGSPVLVLPGGQPILCDVPPLHEADLRLARSFSHPQLPMVLLRRSSAGAQLPERGEWMDDALRADAVLREPMRLLARFEGTPEGRRFVEPRARLGLLGEKDRPVLSALRDWLKRPEPLCMLGGDPGSGRSTVARKFAAALALEALEGRGPAVVYVDFRGESLDLGPLGTAVKQGAAGSLELLRDAIQEGVCVLILDGLEQCSRLKELKEVIDFVTREGLGLNSQTRVLCVFSFPELLQFETPEAEAEHHRMSRQQRRALAATTDSLYLVTLEPFDERRIRAYLGLAAVGSEKRERWIGVLNASPVLLSLARLPALLSALPPVLEADETFRDRRISELMEHHFIAWSEQASQRSGLSADLFRRSAEGVARLVWEQSLLDNQPHSHLFKDPDEDKVSSPSVQLNSCQDLLCNTVLNDEPLPELPASLEAELQYGAFIRRTDLGQWQPVEKTRPRRLSLIPHFGRNTSDAKIGFVYPVFCTFLVARQLLETLTPGTQDRLGHAHIAPEVIRVLVSHPSWGSVRPILQQWLCAGSLDDAGTQNALRIADMDRLLTSSIEHPWNLAGRSLKGLKLDQPVFLEGANLEGSYLMELTLRGAKFGKANLRGANLERADLRDADFTYADARDLNARYSQVDGSVWDHANLTNADLRGSRALNQPPRMTDATLNGLHLDGCVWRQLPSLVAPVRGLTRREESIDASVNPPRWRVPEPTILGPSDFGYDLCAAWAEDDQALLVGTYDGRIVTHEVPTRRARSIHQVSDYPLEALALTLTDDRLAVVNRRGEISVWIHPDFSLLPPLESPGPVLRRLEWSPDGRWLAGCSGSAHPADKTLFLWETGDQPTLLRLEGHAASVRDVLFHPDGQRLISLADGGEVIEWMLSDQTLSRRWSWTPKQGEAIPTQPHHAKTLQLSRDRNRLLVCLSNTEPVVLTAETLELSVRLQSSNHDVIGWSLEDGEVFALSFRNWHRFDPQTGQAHTVPAKAPDQHVSLDGVGNVWSKRRDALTQRGRSYTQILQLFPELRAFHLVREVLDIGAIRFSTSSEHLYVQVQDTVQSWDLSTCQCESVLVLQEQSAFDLRFLAVTDSRCVTREEHHYILRHIPGGAVVGRLHMAIRDNSGDHLESSRVLSPNGQLMVGKTSKFLGVWSLKDGKLLYQMNREKWMVGWDSSCVSDNGQRIAALQDPHTYEKHKVALWVAEQPICPRSFLPPPEGVKRVHLSPDGCWLATLTDDTVQLWNVDALLSAPTDGLVDGMEVISAEALPDVKWTLVWRSDCRRLCFAPSGQWLAVTTLTHVAVVDASTGTLVREWPVNVKNGGELVFSPDSRRLAVVCRGGGVALLDTQEPERVAMLHHFENGAVAVTGGYARMSGDVPLDTFSVNRDGVLSPLELYQDVAINPLEVTRRLRRGIG